MGGIEYYIQNLALALQQKGCEVKVCIPVYSDAEMEGYVYNGVQVAAFKSCMSRGRLSLSGLEPNESLDNFKKLLEQEKPDIVHFNQFTNSNGLALHHIIAAKASGAKIVYTNHLSEFICLRGNFLYMGQTVCDGIIDQKKCTACVMNKDGYSTRAALVGSYLDSMAVKLVGKQNYRCQVKPFILPGFHIRWHLEKIKTIIKVSDGFVSIAGWFTELLKQNKLYRPHCVTINTGLKKTGVEVPAIGQYDGTRALQVIYAGRLMPVKGIDVLIEAVKQIPAHKIQLNIYGPEDTETGGDDKFSACCKDLAGNSPNIFFNGRVDNTAIPVLLRQNDMLCIPSKGNEMAPLIIQEALAAGTPIAGSSLPAIEEWVTDGHNGFIFATGNASDLKDKLLMVINNPEILTAFRSKLSQPGSVNSMVNDYYDLYQSILHKKSA